MSLGHTGERGGAVGGARTAPVLIAGRVCRQSPGGQRAASDSGTSGGRVRRWGTKRPCRSVPGRGRGSGGCGEAGRREVAGRGGRRPNEELWSRRAGLAVGCPARRSAEAAAAHWFGGRGECGARWTRVPGMSGLCPAGGQPRMWGSVCPVLRTALCPRLRSHLWGSDLQGEQSGALQVPLMPFELWSQAPGSTRG